MTRRLYYDDAYRLEFTAKLTEIVQRPDGALALVLDQTLFYPTSGGQMHDRGRLGDLEVHDVIDEAGRILHLVEGTAPVVGSELIGTIDADRRAHHRQQHSGQHVLSRVIEDRYGWPTLSSRLGETLNTLEIAAAELSFELLAEIEDRANHTIWQGHPVHIRYLDEKEAADQGLRRKVEREGPLRVIEIEGVDRCACGGTHVRNSSEIGLIVITGSEKVRGGTRLQFLCGERAVQWRRARVHWLDQTARCLTTGQDLVSDTVRRLQEENRDRSKRLKSMARELVAARIPGWREAAVRTGEFDAVLRILDEDEALAASEAVRALVKGTRLLAVFVIVEGGKRQVLVARGADVDVDCGALLGGVLEGFGGRGGGRAEFARGGCGDVTPARLLDAFREALGSDTDERGQGRE